MRVMSELGLYCVSKSAVIQMTKSMALEWGEYGINVNAICPGYISTEINQGYFDTDESRFLNEAIVTADDGMSIY